MGIYRYADPLPAELAAKAAPVAALFGDAVARCLYAKAWSAREAALQHIERQMLLVSGNSRRRAKTHV